MLTGYNDKIIPSDAALVVASNHPSYFTVIPK